MKFKKYLEEAEDDVAKDEDELPPEESELDDNDDSDQSENDGDNDEEEVEDTSVEPPTDIEDGDAERKISELLPKILSGTFKTLEEITIPVDTFLANSELTKDDLQYWVDNYAEIYPDLTHIIELDDDNDNVIIREVGIDDEDLEDEEGEEEGGEDEDEDDLFSDEDEEENEPPEEDLADDQLENEDEGRQGE